MHAYLIVGESNKQIESKIEEIRKKYQLKIYDFTVEGITDFRKIGSFTNLKITHPTGIVIRGIENVKIEALNAFLKNLEEPQSDLYYILVVPNIRGIIPTLISRCLVISLKRRKDTNRDDKFPDFLLLPTDKKLQLVDKIANRKSALDFINSLILKYHPYLTKKDENIRKTARILSLAEKTRQALMQNGNTRLHLINFVINI